MRAITDPQRSTLALIERADDAWKIVKVDGSQVCAAEVDGGRTRLHSVTCKALYMRDLIEIGFGDRHGSPVTRMTITDAGRAALRQEQEGVDRA